MTSLERQRSLSEQSTILNLFNKLADTTCMEQNPNMKILRATVGRDLFEQHNVSSSIYKSLLSAKAQRYITITITPTALTIDASNTQKTALHKKASLTFVSEESSRRSSLYVARGKRKGVGGFKAKDIHIGFEECSKIIRTVEAIAQKQGLIKQ